MIVGVDASVLIGAVHANHPMHTVASPWLDHAGADVIVTLNVREFRRLRIGVSLPSPYAIEPAWATTPVDAPGHQDPCSARKRACWPVDREARSVGR